MIQKLNRLKQHCLNKFLKYIGCGLINNNLKWKWSKYKIIWNKPVFYLYIKQVIQPLFSAVPGFKFIRCQLFSHSFTGQIVIEPPGTVYMMIRKISMLPALLQLRSGEGTQTNIKFHSENCYKGEFYCPHTAYNSGIWNNKSRVPRGSEE